MNLCFCRMSINDIFYRHLFNYMLNAMFKGHYVCKMSHTWSRGMKGGECNRAITVEGRMPRIHITATTFDRGLFGI